MYLGQTVATGGSPRPFGFLNKTVQGTKGYTKDGLQHARPGSSWVSAIGSALHQHFAIAARWLPLADGCPLPVLHCAAVSAVMPETSAPESVRKIVQAFVARDYGEFGDKPRFRAI
jgi:hypothetical protein